MKKKSLFCLCIFLLLAMALPLTVFADMGPKPMVTVRVVNPPQGTYYLDLLTYQDGSFSNLTEEERASLDPEMLAVLENYSDSYGHPAIAAGTDVPLFGQLTGEPDGDGYVHVFSYHGVPSDFRLIAVTEDLNVIISEPIDRDVLQIHLTWDMAANRVTRPSTFLAYLTQFLGTLLPTLAIEGLLLLLFRFSTKRNWLVFLLTNLATQLFLFLVLGIPTVKGGYLTYYFTFLPAELIILLAESAVYAFLLQGRKKGWRIAYAVTANVASCAAGFFLAEPLFRLTTRLL